MRPEHCLYTIPLRLRSLFRRREADQELDEELRDHVERKTEEYVANGLPLKEARRQALLEMGGVEKRKEECRDTRGVTWLRDLLQDLRYGLRVLRKSPGFTAVAILTLALGIGANTAIFSLIDGILLRALPVRDAQNLIVLRWSALHSPEIHNWSEDGDCKVATGSRDAEASSCSFSEPFFHAIASHIDTFSGIAAFSGGRDLDVSGNGAVRVLDAEAVSGEFFSMLGVRPAAGRLIVPGDDAASAPPVLVLNYGYWKSEFGGSLSVIGKTVRVNDVPFTIIGVANPQFDSLSPGEVRDAWIPLSVLPRLSSGTQAKERETDVYAWWLVIIGRLKPGVSRLQAQTAVSALFHNEMLHGAKPLSKPADDPRVAALPAQSALTGSKTRYSTELYVLMAAVGIVLLIACANVAGLLLARAAVRQKEIAVRLALGAGPRRIVRQLLAESVLLSIVGGALGILFAAWGTQAIVSLMTGGTARAFGFSPGIDGRVLAFTLTASVLTGIVFGLAPAVLGTRVNLTPALKESSGGSASRGRAGRWFSFGDTLVIAQVALAAVVLVGAGLLVGTLQNLRSVDPGFDTRNLLTFRLDPALIGYKRPQTDAFYRDLRQRLATLPAVRAVSYSNNLLLSGSLTTAAVHLPGTPKDKYEVAAYLGVGENFFSAMHVDLLAGRTFTAADFAQKAKAYEKERKREEAEEAKDAGISATGAAAGNETGAAEKSGNPASENTATQTPAIVNKTFVEKYFPKMNPLGHHFELDGTEQVIVGVVNDARYRNLRMPVVPTLYSPWTGPWVSFEVRTRSNPLALVPAVRSIVKQMDSSLPIFDVRTQAQIIDQLLSHERMIAQLSGFFGLLALALACVGLYGLLSYEVARRTREIGIRMALGARGGDVLRMVVKQGVALALTGVAIGTGAAIGVTRYLNSFLYGVHAGDPATMVAAAVLLTLIALAACYVPARRAMRVDPMVALRYE